MVMRVSLSDWLAFQARIRGSKDPRLLRDRPPDGAAWVAKICAVIWRGHCGGNFMWGVANFACGLRRGMIDHRLSKITCGAAAAFSVRWTVFE